MRARAALGLLAVPFVLSCENLDRFDTKGKAAYCGQLVSAQFALTPPPEGLDRRTRLQLKLDTSQLTTTPGSLKTDDPGVCAGGARTFDEAPLQVTSEIVHDALSSMTFEQGQVQNVIAWVDSSCRGRMLAIVSLYKDEHVEVRLLQPGATTSSAPARDAFAHFFLYRQDSGCPSY